MKKTKHEKSKAFLCPKNSKNFRGENIYNLPNLITLTRVLITFYLFYMIFTGKSLLSIAIVFVIGMITDALDGHTARKYDQVTEFGRKFDMIADRFLFIVTISSIMVVNIIKGYFTNYDILLIILLLIREIIALPFAIIGFFLKKPIPQAKFIGKLTTVLQAIAFPIVLLRWNIAVYASCITALVGFFSALTYIKDLGFLKGKIRHKK